MCYLQYMGNFCLHPKVIRYKPNCRKCNQQFEPNNFNKSYHKKCKYHLFNKNKLCQDCGFFKNTYNSVLCYHSL